MTQINTSQLQDEIAAIKQRNARVDANKAWETSRFRLYTIALFTYLMMLLLMVVIGTEQPFISAIVPTAGFLLSNLSVRLIKQYWLERIYQPRD